MPHKKDHGNIVLNFAKGFLTNKKNVSPAAKFVQAQEKKKAALKKLGY